MMLGIGGASYHNAELFAWGFNDHGSLGLGQGPAQLSSKSSPTQIPGTEWASCAQTCCGPGPIAAAATKQDGTLWAWGRNGNGQLGQNDRNSRSSPVQVGAAGWDTGIRKVAVGNGRIIGVKKDGTLWGVGSGYAGALGLNNENRYSSPVQISSDTTWNAVACDLAAVLATKTDGTAWSWGNKEYGQLGQGDDVHYSSPTQLPGTNWTNKIQAGPRHFGVIKTDGTLWMWGSGYSGELGQGNRSRASSPKQVPGTNWSHIGMGANATYALKSNGESWQWGMNQDGGGGLAINYGSYPHVAYDFSSPKQVPGTTWGYSGGDYSDFADGGCWGISDGGFMMRTDGTLWSWGRQREGVRGLNGTQNPAYWSGLSSPVQIPGTNWLSGGGGEMFAIAIKESGN